MAKESRAPRDVLLAHLFSKGAEASFYDTLVLLESLFPDAPHIGHRGSPGDEKVWLRPSTGLSFPASDLDAVRGLPDGSVEVTTNFLGLYGADSPLPNPYIEHFIGDDRATKRSRALVDIFHHRLLALLYRCLGQYRVRKEASPQVPVLQQILGLVNAVGKDPDCPPSIQPRDARIQIFRTRTSDGLEAHLFHRLKLPIRVQPLRRRRVRIKPNQATQLGVGRSVLGSSFLLGQTVFDRNRANLIVFAPNWTTYMDFVPGAPSFEKIRALLRTYLRSPIEHTLLVSLRTKDIVPWSLGQDHRIGRNTWLGRPQKSTGKAAFKIL